MSLDSMLYEVEAFREEMEDYVGEMESRKGLWLDRHPRPASGSLFWSDPAAISQ